MNVAWNHSTLVLAAQNVTGRTHLWNFICTSIIFSTSKNPVNIMLHWLLIVMCVHLFLKFFVHDFTVLCAIRPWMWGLFWEMDWWHVEGGVHNSRKDFFLLLFDRQEETTKDIPQDIWIPAKESDSDNPSCESEVSTTQLQHYWCKTSVRVW